AGRFFSAKAFHFLSGSARVVKSAQDETWVGVPISLADAKALAERCGFESICSSGQGTQYFWLWFLKFKWPFSRLRKASSGIRQGCFDQRPMSRTRPAAPGVIWCTRELVDGKQNGQGPGSHSSY